MRGLKVNPVHGTAEFLTGERIKRGKEALMVLSGSRVSYSHVITTGFLRALYVILLRLQIVPLSAADFEGTKKDASWARNQKLVFWGSLSNPTNVF